MEPLSGVIGGIKVLHSYPQDQGFEAHLVLRIPSWHICDLLVSFDCLTSPLTNFVFNTSCSFGELCGITGVGLGKCIHPFLYLEREFKQI